jgi:hypothetical protein
VRLRKYEYKLESKVGRVVRGTRFRPRETHYVYRVIGSDDFKSDWVTSRNSAISYLNKKAVEWNQDVYNVDYDPKEGTLTVNEMAWSEPKVSYRLVTFTEKNDIYYSIEEMYKDQKKWKRIIHTPDHNTAIHKMMVMAEHNILDEAADGLLVAGNYNIIVIGKDGYTYGGRDVNEITGAYVVSK